MFKEEGKDSMAPYHHTVNTHHRSKRASRVKKVAKFASILAVIAVIGVGIDWTLTNIKNGKTVVSTTSSATVQSAQINIFQSPYFRFQADSSWREVTDELNLNGAPDGSSQYLYRSFDKNFIEHELWVTVNLPEDYKVALHNIPTRVQPVRIEEDGSLSLIGSVSKPCMDVLEGEKPDVSPQVVKQLDVEYFCHPNEVNDFTVVAGVPGATNRLSMPHDETEKVVITLTYRNIKAIPEASMFERILLNFKSL